MHRLKEVASHPPVGGERVTKPQWPVAPGGVVNAGGRLGKARPSMPTRPDETRFTSRVSKEGALTMTALQRRRWRLARGSGFTAEETPARFLLARQSARCAIRAHWA